MPTEDEILLQEVMEDLKKKKIPHRLGREDFKYHPPGTVDQSWIRCSDLISKYDKELCEASREQIDTLLVFAGLFSAVVTAFTAESYQWLHNDSGDVTVQLLAQIAHVLNGTTVSAPATSALSDAAARRINAYWFLSLTLSLSAALVGILAKQWIREYDRDAGRTHPESIGVRQMKYQGLETWGVSEIISSVPLLLQLALALFSVGVLELLWRLDAFVAIPVTIAAILAFSFYMATTIIPAAHTMWWYYTPDSAAAQCPYKSPQAWIVLRGFLRLFATSPPRKLDEYLEHRNFVLGYDSEPLMEAVESLRKAPSWITFDLAWTAVCDTEASRTRPEYKFEALAWLRETVDHPELLTWIWHCVFESWERGFSLGPARFSENILACMSDNGQEYPIRRITDGPSEKKRNLLLPYAVETEMPLPTIVALLCQCFQSGEQLETDSWFCQWVLKLRSTEQLPDELCDDLVYPIFSMASRSHGLPAFGQVVSQVLFLTRLHEQPPPPHWIRRSLSLCVLARLWLQAGQGHQEEPDLAARVATCHGVFFISMWLLGGTRDGFDYELHDTQPYTPTTLVLARMAKAINDTHVSLRGSGDYDQGPFDFVPKMSIFRELVSIATSLPEESDVPRSTAEFAYKMHLLSGNKGRRTSFVASDTSDGEDDTSPPTEIVAGGGEAVHAVSEPGPCTVPALAGELGGTPEHGAHGLHRPQQDPGPPAAARLDDTARRVGAGNVGESVESAGPTWAHGSLPEGTKPPQSPRHAPGAGSADLRQSTVAQTVERTESAGTLGQDRSQTGTSGTAEPSVPGLLEDTKTGMGAEQDNGTIGTSAGTLFFSSQWLPMRSSSVDLELGVLRVGESASPPPAACTDECVCDICTRERM